jgi:CRP/FNR family transcriptional regulator, cyclic AMP receptor protein
MDLSAKLFVLKENPYLASLPPSEARELVARLRERHYRAGAVIFRKDERCEGLFIVLSGRIRTSITSIEGREQVLKVFGPGRTFADIPVFDDEPLPADAVAVTDSTVVIVSQRDVRDLLRRHPEVALDVIRLFASRLRAYKLVVEDLSLRDVVGRVARLLRDHARGEATLVEDSASLNLRYTQNELAAMVGSVREVVQRALKALEDAGVIQMTRGRIRITDVEALGVWMKFEGVTGAPDVTGTHLASHSGRLLEQERHR